jgi:hypothetical protein
MKIKSVKLLYDENNELEFYHVVIGDKTWQVPINPSNRHYAAVLEWLAEGNTPEPADSE